MVGKRKEQKAQTRERIITAAFKVYSERGFSANTTAITDEAGISHGAIFVHFPNVESLLLCLLDRFGEDIKAELHELAEFGDMAALLDMHLRVLIQHEAFYKRLVTEAVYLPDEARNTFIAIQSAVSIHFVQALKQEVAAGRVKDIPFHMVFNTWLGLVHYYLLNSELFAPNESVLTRHKDALVENFLALIHK
ncbi:MAG: TetR/AcrR family transcriptional regulator [Sphaerochaetaceae bacterium]